MVPVDFSPSIADRISKLIFPTVGAAVLFALAILCAGESAGITATLAGQVVSEGFLRWHISVRSYTIIPKIRLIEEMFSLLSVDLSRGYLVLFHPC